MDAKWENFGNFHIKIKIVIRFPKKDKYFTKCIFKIFPEISWHFRGSLLVFLYEGKTLAKIWKNEHFQKLYFPKIEQGLDFYKTSCAMHKHHSWLVVDSNFVFLVIGSNARLVSMAAQCSNH